MSAAARNLFANVAMQLRHARAKRDHGRRTVEEILRVDDDLIAALEKACGSYEAHAAVEAEVAKDERAGALHLTPAEEEILHRTFVQVDAIFTRILAMHQTAHERCAGGCPASELRRDQLAMVSLKEKLMDRIAERITARIPPAEAST